MCGCDFIINKVKRKESSRKKLDGGSRIIVHTLDRLGDTFVLIDLLSIDQRFAKKSLFGESTSSVGMELLR